jgi:hypothetical protein
MYVSHTYPHNCKYHSFLGNCAILFDELHCTSVQEEIVAFNFVVQPKRWYFSDKLHDVTSKKTVIIIFTAVRNSAPNCTRLFSLTA